MIKDKLKIIKTLNEIELDIHILKIKIQNIKDWLNKE